MKFSPNRLNSNVSSGSVASQRLLQQVGGEIAAAPPFFKGMPLEFIHHAPGSVTLMRSSWRPPPHRRCWGLGQAIEQVLQLLNQILKKRHEQYLHDNCTARILPNFGVPAAPRNGWILGPECNHCR